MLRAYWHHPSHCLLFLGVYTQTKAHNAKSSTDMRTSGINEVNITLPQDSDPRCGWMQGLGKQLQIKSKTEDYRHMRLPILSTMPNPVSSPVAHIPAFDSPISSPFKCLPLFQLTSSLRFAKSPFSLLGFFGQHTPLCGLL